MASAANMLVVGPMAARVMEKRKKVMGGLAGGLGGEVGKELGNERLKELGKTFGRVHGVSTVLNLVGLVAVGVVGWGVGKRLH